MRDKMVVKNRGNKKISSISSSGKEGFDVRIIVKRGVITIIILSVLSLLIEAFSSLGYLESFRIIFGSVFVLFLPGFILSYVFFPFSKKFDEKENDNTDENGDEENDGKADGGNAIDWLERFALSFALSIAVVPLIVFYLNLIGIRISLINVFLEILAILIISVLLLKYRLRKINMKIGGNK